MTNLTVKCDHIFENEKCILCAVNLIYTEITYDKNRDNKWAYYDSRDNAWRDLRSVQKLQKKLKDSPFKIKFLEKNTTVVSIKHDNL